MCAFLWNYNTYTCVICEYKNKPLENSIHDIGKIFAIQILLLLHIKVLILRIFLIIFQLFQKILKSIQILFFFKAKILWKVKKMSKFIDLF